MMVPDHTFVIPAYKDSVFLEDCIKSLTRQSIPSKILIATSTPTPSVLEIAKRHNIVVDVNINGGDIAKDWNFAYKSCATKYLTLAHQDDIYLPEYTEKCLRIADKKSNADTVIIFTNYSEYEIDRPRNASLGLMLKKILLGIFLVKKNIKSKFIKKSVLALGNPISCPSVMFNTQNIGSFKFSEEYHYNMDWDAWLRLAKMQGRFIYVKDKLMIHRLHNDSQTSIQIRNKNRLEEEERIFRTIWGRHIARLLMKIYKFSSVLNSF